MHTYIYIYIYIEREREIDRHIEREREPYVLVGEERSAQLRCVPEAVVDCLHIEHLYRTLSLNIAFV